MTATELDCVLDRHDIPPRHRRNFRLLVRGKITDPRFRRRLHHHLNYKAACDEILELLSRPYAHLFGSSPVSLTLENV